MKKSYLLSLLTVLVTSLVALGQSPPYSACFTANTYRGCAPLAISVASCSPSGPPSQPSPVYNYNFNNQPGAIPIANTTYTYSTPGLYVIRQTVNDGVSSLATVDDTVIVLGQPNPLFTVDVCAGNVARVTITDTNYDLFDIDFGDASSIMTAAQGAVINHTYPNTNSRTISVTGRYTGLCSGPTITRTITPITTLTTPDIIDLTVSTQAVSTGAIALRYSVLANRIYKVESKINNGVYSTHATYTATAAAAYSHSLTGLNTQNNTYTFRVQNIDMCGNTSASSAEIASIIVAPTALNGSNQVAFNSNGGLTFTNYDLYKNNALLQANATSPHNDNTVICGSTYCYKVTGTLATTSTSTGTNHQSFSAPVCVNATYSGIAPVVTNVNSTVQGDNVKVVWDIPTLNVAIPSVSFYTIYRLNGGSYVNYGSSNSNSYIDNGASPGTQAQCYEILYKDACNNVSLLSTNSCTVYLTVTRTDEINYLSWTPYTGYTSTGIKEYIVENLDESGNVLISKSVGMSTSLTEATDPTLAQVIYRIKVVPNGTENLTSYSNVVRLNITPQVFMPTVFTPNGDGDNDVLEIKGKYYKSVKMTIMNKWGEVIFISEDATKGWDGNYKGQPVSVDSYAYHVVALDNAGNEISLKGIISLMR